MANSIRYVVAEGVEVGIVRGRVTEFRAMRKKVAFTVCVEREDGTCELSNPRWPGVLVVAHQQDVEVREMAPVCTHCLGSKVVQVAGMSKPGCCWACRGKGWQSEMDVRRHAKYTQREVRVVDETPHDAHVEAYLDTCTLVPELTQEEERRQQVAEDAANDPSNYPLYFAGAQMKVLPRSIHRRKASV